MNKGEKVEYIKQMEEYMEDKQIMDIFQNLT